MAIHRSNQQLCQRQAFIQFGKHRSNQQFCQPQAFTGLSAMSQDLPRAVEEVKDLQALQEARPTDDDDDDDDVDDNVDDDDDDDDDETARPRFTKHGREIVSHTSVHLTIMFKIPSPSPCSTDSLPIETGVPSLLTIVLYPADQSEGHFDFNSINSFTLAKTVTNNCEENTVTIRCDMVRYGTMPLKMRVTCRYTALSSAVSASLAAQPACRIAVLATPQLWRGTGRKRSLLVLDLHLDLVNPVGSAPSPTGFENFSTYT
ncbi:hypothetical protein PoB_007344300 [Plakobranchus ocellatus]|uniref:Uncharacterized protein n=1 Tax=Plakobranchus ocellatus TaxID=259542 RepID=A0AAV4DRN2_9GAST|nr:hypothetical protein PoB_007344300 [Plakobranchus ocellatus]